MIRFVDLTGPYWTVPKDGQPCCAFLDTVHDTFIAAFDGGSEVFDSLAQVRAIPDIGERCAGLVPEGFFEPEPSEAPPSNERCSACDGSGRGSIGRTRSGVDCRASAPCQACNGQGSVRP